jgi:hypothetical protein
MKQYSFISDFSNAAVIETFAGPISGMRNIPLPQIGFSASVLERIDAETAAGPVQSFILKKTVLHTDWLSQRTNDNLGREAAILREESLFKIWESIHCPYLAFAIEDGQIALLMNDLSGYLFPDQREPVDSKTEETVLNTLASLHAAFWELPALKEIDWLAKPFQYFEAFGPGIHATDSFAPPPDKLAGSMALGWETVIELLPANIASVLLQPAEKIFDRWRDLPVTFLHGDAKLANMALMPGGRLSLFDWAFAGRGPCGIELGWYIAVNATRLSRSKDEAISAYRLLLEAHLQHPVEDNSWTEMVDLAIVTGARMLLWNKALAFRAGTERAKNEWDWWIQKLTTTVAHFR